MFEQLSEKSMKRAHFELSHTMSIDEETPVPEFVPFSHFAKDLNDHSSTADAIKAFGAYLDKKQERDDIKDTNSQAAVKSLRAAVDTNSVRISRLERFSQRHDANLSIFEITVSGLHGENYAHLRENFLQVCAFLKVGIEPLDISSVRYLKQDRSSRRVKSHSVVVRLHSSKLVSIILDARKEGSKRKQLKHVDIFPALTATDRFIYLRPMLTDSKQALLKLANAAKEKLGYKFCWVNDYGTIYLKRDEAAEPIVVRDEKCLQGLPDGPD